MTQRKVEWVAGFVALVAGALCWTIVVRAAHRVQERAAAAKIADLANAVPVASRAACKPAWRLSRETLEAIHWPNAGEQNALDALLAIPDDAWETENAKRVLSSSHLATCAPDQKGAWVLAIHPPRVDAGASTRRVEVELKRLTNDDKVQIRSVILNRYDSDGEQTSAYDVNEVSSVSLSAIPDMNNDGVPEVKVNGALFTTRSGEVNLYPGTMGHTVMDVKDDNGDGRPDVFYGYVVDGGYDTACGGTAETEFSSPLVAITDASGVLQFNDRRAREVALAVCPTPPAAADKDALCALVWGFEKRAIPDYEKLRTKCMKENEKADEEASEEPSPDDNYPHCSERPSTRECGHFQPWQDLTTKTFPLTLWPPLPGEEFARSAEENDAIAAAKDALSRARKAMAKKNWTEAMAAYHEAAAYDQPDVVEAELAYARVRNGDAQGAATALEALIPRLEEPAARAASLYNLGLAKEELGDAHAANLAFLRSNQLRPSKDAKAKLGDAKVCAIEVATGEAAAMSLEEWKKSAGEEHATAAHPPVGGYYDTRYSSDPAVLLFGARRFPGEKREAYYKLDPASGRVSRCVIARGCACTKDSPCTRGLAAHPPPMREVSIFSKETSRRLARITWPDDASESDPNVSVSGGELRVTGLGCSEKVKVTP